MVGRVPATGPVLRGRVEDHLDVLGPGRLPLDEREQRRVHLVDHSRSLAPAWTGRPAGAVPPCEHGTVPVRAARPAREATARDGPRKRVSSLPCSRAHTRVPVGRRREGYAVTDPILRLEPARLSVEPGGQATVTLTVTNPGNIVEGYSVDVVSTIPIPWVEVNPSTLSVYPQQEATTVIVFSPPSGSGAPSGTLPFGVRVWSEVEGGGSAVAEGDLDIGSVAGLQAKLTPIASTGRWSGRHTLTISNWGNAPARLRIVPEDPDQALGFLVSPGRRRRTAGRRGRRAVEGPHPAPHPAWRRPTASVPGRLRAGRARRSRPGRCRRRPTAGRPVVDGAFNQKPILTRMVVVVAGLRRSWRSSPDSSTC